MIKLVALKMVKQQVMGSTTYLKWYASWYSEIVKQGNKYGVKLKAVAPSIHLIRVDVGTFDNHRIRTSKELINYLMKDYDAHPDNIWKSEIFGRGLDVIVQEGIQAKLLMVPENIKYKLQHVLSKVVNKGSNNMIAIVL